MVCEQCIEGSSKRIHSGPSHLFTQTTENESFEFLSLGNLSGVNGIAKTLFSAFHPFFGCPLGPYQVFFCAVSTSQGDIHPTGLFPYPCLSPAIKFQWYINPRLIHGSGLSWARDNECRDEIYSVLRLFTVSLRVWVSLPWTQSQLPLFPAS